jgi:ribonucleoside-diphosphate reductase alpha chain
LGNNCSSGIEPIFSLQYDRSIRQDDDTTKTQTVYDDGWLEYIEYAGYKEGNDLPDYVVVSHNVSITEGIDIQAALQYWIDHSISKTINMPFETTLEQYKDIFMYSWKKGLKGVTSFHEGASMDGILSTKKDDGWRNIEVLKNAMKRPESLPCDIYDITVNKEPVIVLVGKNPDSPYNNAPYEIFYTDNHDDIVDLKRFKEGSIVKVYDGAEKASRYDLLIEGKRSKIVVENLAEVFNDDYASMCRLLSLLMRHQVPLEFIVAQMNKVKKFGTFQKAIARVLKYYIPDGEMISSNKAECPECGGTMVFEGGCTVCSSCGYSTCG